MKYSRPEVAILGDAHTVIQFVPSKVGTGTEFGYPRNDGNPSYDLDE